MNGISELLMKHYFTFPGGGQACVDGIGTGVDTQFRVPLGIPFQLGAFLVGDSSVFVAEPPFADLSGHLTEGPARLDEQHSAH